MKTKSAALSFHRQDKERYIRLTRVGLILASGCALLLSATSCSDDKDTPLPTLSEKTYTGANTLRLTYDGYDMPGKSVTVTPGENGEATLTLFSEFDLSQLDIKGVSGNIPAPGVIPGDIRTIIKTHLTDGKGYRSFSGNADTGKMTFNYSGKIYGDSLIMNVTDARLANTSLVAGTWKLASLKKNTEGIGYESMPFHIVWEADPIEGMDIPLSEILRLAVTVPCIPVYHDTAYSSVSQLLGQLIESVKFMPDGNIIIRYMNSVGGSTRLVTLNGTTLQYTVTNPQYLNLYVNPLSVAGLAMTSGVLNELPTISDEKIEAILPVAKQLLAKLAPQIAGGIPLAYSQTDSSLSVYADQNLAVPLLQTIIETILSDSSSMQALMAEVKKYPELSQQLPKIMEALNQLPNYLEKTIRFEFGLAFVPYM